MTLSLTDTYVSRQQEMNELYSLETILVTITVQTYISRVEVISHVCKLPFQLVETLALRMVECIRRFQVRYQVEETYI